jgi:hypothetical protein
VGVGLLIGNQKNQSILFAIYFCCHNLYMSTKRKKSSKMPSPSKGKGEGEKHYTKSTASASAKMRPKSTASASAKMRPNVSKKASDKSTLTLDLAVEGRDFTATRLPRKHLGKSVYRIEYRLPDGNPCVNYMDDANKHAVFQNRNGQYMLFQVEKCY